MECQYLQGFFVAKMSTRTSALIGTVFFSAGYVASSFITEIWHLYFSYSILVGLGMSQLGGPPQASIIATWVPRANLGLCMGISISGASVGALLTPYWFQTMQENLGLPNTLRIIAAVAFVINILTSLVLLPQLEKPYHPPNLKVITQLKLLPLFVGLPILLFGYWIIFVFVTPYAHDILNMSQDEASTLLIVIGGTNFIGRIASGYMADHFGALPVFLLHHLRQRMPHCLFSPHPHQSCFFYLHRLYRLRGWWCFWTFTKNFS